MKLTHSSLLKLGKLLGYPLLDKGLCQGYSVMLALAILADDELSFYDRLDLMELYAKDMGRLRHDIKSLRNILKETDSHLLNKKEYDVLEIPAFFEGVGAYLNPGNLKFLSNNEYVNQSDVKQVYSLVRPKALENLDITFLIDREFVFDRVTLEQWLRDLNEILYQTKTPIPILLNNDGHSICFNYNLDFQCWIFSDTNDFERFPKEKKYYRKLTTPALADSIFKSFSDNLKKHTVFSTIALAVNPEDQLIRAMINLDAQYPFKPEHASLFNNHGAGLLYIACKFGRLEAVIKLLEFGANPYQLINKKYTPLYVAAMQGRTEIVKEILKKNPEEKIINRTVNDCNLLQVVTHRGYLEIAKELIKVTNKKGLYTPQGKSKITPLQIAAGEGHVELLKAYINSLQEEKLISQADLISSLHSAIIRNQLEIIQELLKVIKDEQQITKPISKGVTIVHSAVIEGKLEIIQELLNSIHDKTVINQPDNDGVTPFHIAIIKNLPELVEILLKNGADIDKPMPVATEKLLQSAKNFKFNLRKLFIQENIGKIYLGFTPLQVALFFGHAGIVELLIKNGAKCTSHPQGISLYRFAVATDNIDLLPQDLHRYHQLAKEQHPQEEKMTPPLRLFDIKPDKRESLKLLTSNLQMQFEGIKEIAANNGELTLFFTSPESAHSANRTFNNTKIKTHLMYDYISISANDINKFMKIYGIMNQSILFADEDLKSDKGCCIS